MRWLPTTSPRNLLNPLLTRPPISYWFEPCFGQSTSERYLMTADLKI